MHRTPTAPNPPPPLSPSSFVLRSSLFVLLSSFFALRSSLFVLLSSVFAFRSSLFVLPSSFVLRSSLFVLPSFFVLRSSLFALLSIAALLTSPLPGHAQPLAPRDELLKLVPPDAGFCLLVNDLRGQMQKWQRSPWVQSLRQQPLVQELLGSPEGKQIAAMAGELKKHLGIDWTTLRDDVFGDAVVIAYRPAPPGKPELEQGMIALHAARPALLAQLVERFNGGPQGNRAPQPLEPQRYLGATYYRRVQAHKPQYCYLHGSLFVLAGTEALLRSVIEREQAANGARSPWPERFRRAGAAQNLLTLGINPHVIDPFPRPAKDAAPQGFAGVWRALDAIFLTAAADSAPELRLTLQGRPADMPSWARSLFTETLTPSALWQRFPEPSLLTIAGHSDFAALAQTVLETLPAADRGKLTQDLQGALKLITRLDLFQEVLPNLGPDWGVCVLPPSNGTPLPQLIAALAVQPGKGAEPVDETLFKGARLLVGVAVLDHNRLHPNELIQVESVEQGKVAVKYLAGPKSFPPGVKPAGAVKDGYLVLASTPEAIARFGPREAPAKSSETLLARLTPSALAQFLRTRRDQVVQDIQHKHHLEPREANRRLDQLLDLLDGFDAVTLSQRTDQGQASWILRLRPQAR